MNSNMILSERIKYLRKSRNMTQEEFAKEIGIEAQHISCIERGKKGIGIDKLLLICKKFNVNMDVLLPVEPEDDSEKEKLIEEIVEIVRGMDTVQVGVLRKMIGGL